MDRGGLPSIAASTMVPPPPLAAFLAAGHGTFSPKPLLPMVAQGSSRRITRGLSGATCRPLRISMQDFSSTAYWNKVYSSGQDDSGQQAVSEWHVEGDVFVEEVERLLPAGGPSATAAGREGVAVLNVGCGTSALWESMYDHGWRNITNIDFSKPCIEQGRTSTSSASRPGVKWLVMDACSLTFDDASFDAAIDKGTLDAIACSEAFDWFLPRMARSIVRVLRPGGTWMCVSFTPPEIALPLLEECKEWEVEVEKWRSFWMYVGRKRSI
ncbi:unnamed protein product [Ectocarpus fasciculatus]